MSDLVKKLESTNLVNISPSLIGFDEKNPRGESEDQIKSDKSFLDLRKSVSHYGVLVPLIAAETKNKNKPFRLVDGERRLRAALVENRDTVPVHVINDDESDARILAYNIHMLRKQWDKRIEISSIKEIRDSLIQDNSDMSEVELFAKLREITNHKDHELKDLLRLLKYDSASIKKVQNGTVLMSHLIQIDASFLSPFKREFPILYNRYGDSCLRKIMVEKAENGKIGNTRYLMDNVLTYFKDSENKAKLRSAIKGFLDDPEKEASSIVEKMKVSPKKSKKKVAKKKKKTAKKKSSSFKRDGSEFEYSSINITKGHLTRINDIRPKLEKISIKFTDEETEYIKEAVCCLENHCFKAAALMVWSAGISRILKYIEKHLVDFNKCTKEMNDTPKSFYKWFAPSFMKSATDINDVRENCNDRQLLCYICYKGFINATEFKKLKANYDTRNDCAHPTSILLNPNEIIIIFENVYSLLLDSKKLR